jgi:hypothetical protein
MFKPCRIRLIITNLITTRITLGIHRCHFPSAGSVGMVAIEVAMGADIEVAMAIVVGMVAIGVDKAADGTAAVKEEDRMVAGLVAGTVAGKAEVGTVAGTAEKMLNVGCWMFMSFHFQHTRATSTPSSLPSLSILSAMWPTPTAQ